jgi:hypothetical protein
MPMAVPTPPQYPPAKVADEEQGKRGQQISQKQNNPICVLDPHQYRATDTPSPSAG